MRRFFTEPENVDGQRGVIKIVEDAAHISRVLRMEPGDKVLVFDGSGTEYTAEPVSYTHLDVYKRQVQRTARKKIPFGIAQVGKSFRNEITPGNFIFRTREFEQMELEFFCKPGTDLEWFAYWKDYCKDFLLSLGIKPENMRLRDHDPEELSHYSNATTDIEYLFPFGWGELWGIADRTDFDLKQHSEFSGEKMEYTDPETGEKYIPYCIEPSLGACLLYTSRCV